MFETIHGVDFSGAKLAGRNLWLATIRRDDAGWCLAALNPLEKLAGTLDASDRRKVDEYLDSIREIERRIEKAETDGRTIAPTIDKPAGIPAIFAGHAKLLFDLQFVAFQTDLTRAAIMVIGRWGSRVSCTRMPSNSPLPWRARR